MRCSSCVNAGSFFQRLIVWRMVPRRLATSELDLPCTRSRAAASCRVVSFGVCGTGGFDCGGGSDGCVRMHCVAWRCAVERAARGEKSNPAHAAISRRIAASDGRSFGGFGVGFIFSDACPCVIEPPGSRKMVSPKYRARCAPGLQMTQLFLAEPHWRAKNEENLWH